MRDDEQRELEGVQRAGSGTLPPDAVVDYARDPSTALHRRFEWDDAVAGEAYRIWMARELIKVFAAAIDCPGVPEDVESVQLQLNGEDLLLSRVLLDSGMAKSNGEARRLIKQGGVQVDGRRVTSESTALGRGSYLIRVGKHRLRRIVIGGAR